MSLISGREAAERLRPVGLTRDQATAVLKAGFAGPAVKTRSASLYDAAAVDDLARWPQALTDGLGELSRSGIFVARVGPRTPSTTCLRQWMGVDLTAPEAEQADAVRMYWRIGPKTRESMASRLPPSNPTGFLPLVATVAGFVAVVRDIVSLEGTDDGVVFAVRPAGPWSVAFEHRRFHTGPGGPWTLWQSGAPGQ